MNSSKKTKVYTRSGDKGQTSLIGGKKVAKYHDRIEAYGTVDELMSYIGLICDHNINGKDKQVLLTIQNKLMICASLLASEDEETSSQLPQINNNDIEYLEKSIDEMEKHLPVLKSFILPGGHILSSYCHIARNVCRRAERRIVHLSDYHNVNPSIIKYINRLSDFLFVLSRKLLKDFKVKENLWTPNL